MAHYILLCLVAILDCPASANRRAISMRQGRVSPEEEGNSASLPAGVPHLGASPIPNSVAVSVRATNLRTKNASVVVQYFQAARIAVAPKVVLGARQDGGVQHGSATSLPYLAGVPPLGTLAKPKIFIYNVHESFHEGLVKQYFPGEQELLFGHGQVQNTSGSDVSIPCGTAWANSLVGLQRCLQHSKATHTMDPLEADFYYVPFYPNLCFAPWRPKLFKNATTVAYDCGLFNSVLTDLALAAASGSPLGVELSTRLQRVGLGLLPEVWAKRRGTDHIFPGLQLFHTPYVARELLSSGPARVLLDFGASLPHYEDVVDDAYMQNFGYAQKKDFLIPMHFLRDPSTVLAPDVDAQRDLFMYLASSSTTLVKSSNSTRKVLAKLVKDQPDSLYQELVNRVVPKDIHEHMSRSVFCLAPPGDFQLTTRHADALLAGCIPVLLTDGRVPLPFDNILDWQRFSVQLHTSSVADGTLMAVLRGKTQVEIDELRRNVYAVRPYFMVSSTCGGPSGFDMVLHELALQKSRRSSKL